MKKNLKSDPGSVKSCPVNPTINKSRNTKMGSIKSGKISKYFAPISTVDFDSPYKDLLTEQKPILTDPASEDSDFKTPKLVKNRSKPILTKPASKNVRKGANSNKSKTRQRTLTKMIEDQLTFTDTNAEHLQMAIQLSKSEQLTESVDQDTSNFSIGLSTQQKIVNVKATLEKFGFKSGKITGDGSFETTRRPKNSKFRYVKPVLFLRNEIDRQVIIAEKISSITTQSTPPLPNTTNFIFFLTSPYLQRLQYFGPNYFHRNNTENADDKSNRKSDFYVKDLNIPESELICGSLLKDWDTIPGRAKSPIRTANKTIISDNHKEKEPDNNISNEKYSTCISPDLFDSDDDGSENVVENLNDSIRRSLEMINQHEANASETCDKGIEHFESFNDDVELLSMSLSRRYRDKFETSDDSDIFNINDTSGDENTKNRSGILEFNESIKEYGRQDISVEFTQENSIVEAAENKSGTNLNIQNLDLSSDGYSKKENVESARKDLNITDYIQNMLTQDFFDSDIININEKPDEVLDLTQSSDESMQNAGDIQHSLEELSEGINGNSLAEDFFDSKIINSNDKPDEVLDLTQSSDESMQDGDEIKHNLEELSERIHDNSFEEDLFDSNIINSNNKPAEVLDCTKSFDESMQNARDIQHNVEELSERINDNSLAGDFFYSKIINSNDKPDEVLDLTQSSDESMQNGDEMKHNLEELSKRINDNSLEEDFFDSNISNSNDKPTENFTQSSDKHKLKELSEQINDTSLVEDLIMKPLQTENFNTIDDYSPKKFKKSISFDYYKTEIVKPTPRKTVRKSLTFSSPGDHKSELKQTNDFRTSLESLNDEELNYSSLFSTPFRKKHSEKNDVIIELDSEENATKPNETKEALNKTPIVHQRLKQLTENHVFQTPTSTKSNAFSTPDGVIIKTRNVTPMPDYDRMNTPNILRELEKVGVKSLKRHRGVQILKHIYDATHPLLDEGSNTDDEKIVKRRKSVTFSHGSDRRVEDIRDDTTWQANGSRTDIVGSFPESEELFFERKQSAKILSCAVPLHITWHNFLAGNPELQENILLYEPLQLEVLYAMMKGHGHKYHIQDLITFLDKKCITIRINQNTSQNKNRKIVKNKSN